jgi:hypothetical protein
MTAETRDMRTRLSVLWIFVSLNYLFGRAFTSFGKGIFPDLTGASLLFPAILLETPLAMVVLSRILEYRANRLGNIVVGAVNYYPSLVFLVLSLRDGTEALDFVFFDVMIIASVSLIIWYAWKWPKR